MRDFSRFKNRKNYAQATESTLQLIWIPGIASGRLLKERLGVGYESIIGILRNDYIQWLYDHEDLKKLTEFILEKQEENPNYIEELMELWKKDLEGYKRACEKVEKSDLKSISDEEFVELYKEFLESYYREWSIPIIADAISIHSEGLARHGVIHLLKERGKENEFMRLFPLLTSPVEQSFASEERVDLLNVLANVQRDPELNLKIKMLESEKAVKVLINDKKIGRLLISHVKRYHWIRNSYLMARELKEGNFAAEIAEMAKEGKNAEEEIKKIQIGLEILRKEKREMIKIFKIEGRLRLVLSTIEKFASWQDSRKKQNLIGDHYLYLFLKEFARRLGVDYFDTVYSTPEELLEYFSKGKIDVELMRNRRKFCILAITPDTDFVVEGREAEIFEKIVSPKSLEEYSDIRGQCASIGRVEGFVKIINSEKDMVKMQKGEILVSSMTRPELVPAMKKAAGIITDEGGITSHAAVISREFGIPCVIGTKYATKVLKDGDFVELNANHGVVRKIEK